MLVMAQLMLSSILLIGSNLKLMMVRTDFIQLIHIGRFGIVVSADIAVY